MGKVRLFKEGGQNGDDQSKKPKYINFDNVDYDPGVFKNQISDINGFSSWADNINGMAGSKIRNAVMQRVAEMGRAIIDGSMNYDGIMKFTSGNSKFSSDGKTKKKWFSGNYNSKDENTVNAIAANYVLNILRNSRVNNSQQDNNTQQQNNDNAPENLEEYNIEREYTNRFSPAMLKSLGTGANDYIIRELKEMTDSLSSDEYKKKYTESSLKNAANELNAVNQFYATYNGSNWMDDDKARANMASISSPLYKLLYTAANSEQPESGNENENKPESEKIKEEINDINKQVNEAKAYRDALKAKEEAERNLAISNFRNEYERKNSSSTYRPGVLLHNIVPENTDKNWLNFTNLAFKDGYGEFLSQLSDEYVKTTHNYSNPVDRQRKWLEYLRSPYNNGIMAKYVSESGYKPKTNEEIYGNILSLMSRDNNYSGNKYVLDRTIMNNGGYGLTLSFDNDGIRVSEMNPYYMAKNKFIDDEKYNQILSGLYDYMNSTQKKKNGGVLFFQSGGLMFGNYQYANPVKQNQIQYTDNELSIINNIEKEKKKIDELNKHTEKRIEKANVENDKNLRDGWDGWDTARTLAAVADVGSMAMSFIPGASMAGGVVGLGGSLANFAADWGQDGLQMSDLKNLGINVGMDLLGAIPIVGAGAKSAKVIKSARAIIPMMQFASEMTGDGALTNGYKAINKLVTPNAKMTSQDWKDLLNGVTQLAGLIKSGRGLLKGHSIKKNAKSGKALELEMTKDNKTSRELANINDSQLRELNKRRFGNDGKPLPYKQQIEAQDAFIKEMYGNEFSLNTPVKFREGRFSGIQNAFDPQYKNVYDLENPIDGTWQWGWGRRLVPNRALSDSEKVFVIGKKSGYSKNRFDPKNNPVQDKPQQKTNGKKEAPKKPETEKKAGGGTGMKGSGSVYEKRGGVINRFQPGGTVRNMDFGTDSNSSYESYNASWGDSTGRFIRNELKKLIELKNNAKTPEQIAAFESERNKFAQKMYDINKSYKSMNDKTGFGWGKEMLSPDEITESHQKLFNTLDGANAMIDQYGNLVGRGGTNDKSDKWVDSLNGSKTSLRNIGYSFDDNDKIFQSSEPYKEISDMAKQVGLEYSARNDLSGNGKNYYTFNPYVGERNESLASLAKTPEPAKISVDDNGRITTGSGVYETRPTSLQNDNNEKGIVDIIGGAIGNISDIWRPILIQKTNNEVLNDRLKNMKPTLVSAPKLNAKVYNDYHALKAGENTASRYNMLSDRIANNTSDFYAGLAARLTGASQGEQAMEESRRQSDAMYKSTSQNAIDVFNRNHIAGVQASNQNIAEQNRIADLKSQLRGTVKVNNLMQNWFPYLDDKKRIKYINDGILYNKEYSNYLTGRNKYIDEKLGENWQSNPDTINKARELSIEYMKNAPTPPLLAKRGGTITRRSTASINYGIGNDSYSRYFFRDINQARRDWFNHIRDVASENHKERSHAGKMISDFNKLIGYDKKK